MTQIQKYACVCCGHKVFYREDHLWEICSVCFWQSDPGQDADELSKGGANKVSLREARENYKQFGACEESSMPFVRPPKDDEPKDENWVINDTGRILEALPVKKKWHITINGHKVKVVRNVGGNYSVYHNGYFVNEEAGWLAAGF
jgi:hypothetical protein